MPEKQGQKIEDISIVTAVFNHEDTLADTLDSILMQRTSRRFHIYCMNDASTDKSAEILEDYRSRHPDKITVYTSAENQGSGKKSFLHHKPPVFGTYWCLLAGDDYWTTKDKLEKQVNLLEKSPNSVGCSTYTRVLNEHTGEESMIKPEKQRFNLMDLLIRHFKVYAHPSGLLWRNIFVDTGFFLPPEYVKQDVSGDTVLMHLMLARGGEVINLPEVTSCYRMTGRGVWTKLTRDQQEAANSKIRVILNKIVPFKYRVARKAKKLGLLNKLGFFLPQPINW